MPVTDIWIIDANGGQPTALTTDPENEFTPSWLLDGSRLVFAVFDFRTAAGPYHGRLVSVLPDGTGRKDLGPVAEFDDAVISPDGRYAAWGGGGSDGITLLDRSTGEAKVLTEDGATDPIWSPDGRALLIREPLLGTVAVVAAPSGHLTRFTKRDIESDGRWTLERGSKGEAFDVSSGADNLTGLAPQLTMLAGFPSWASNGGAFAFAGSTSDEVGDRKSEIYVVGLDGQAPARITTGPLDTSPGWEPRNQLVSHVTSTEAH